MEKYSVPGPGDWSIRTSGTMYIEGAEEITVSRSLFDSVGGNAIFLYGYSRWCNISSNEVRYPGDSAFAAVGRTEMVDATRGDFPQDILVEANHLHELGVYGK